jgi:hypothetical protein
MNIPILAYRNAHLSCVMLLFATAKLAHAATLKLQAEQMNPTNSTYMSITCCPAGAEGVTYSNNLIATPTFSGFKVSGPSGCVAKLPADSPFRP